VKSDIAECEEVISSSGSRLKEANSKCAQIEKDINELSNNREGKLAEMKVFFFSLQLLFIFFLFLRASTWKLNVSFIEKRC